MKKFVPVPNPHQFIFLNDVETIEVSEAEFKDSSIGDPIWLDTATRYSLTEPK